MSKGSRPRPVDKKKYDENWENIFGNTPATLKENPVAKKRYVNSFCFDEHGNVLLIRKNRPDYQKGKWNGIGGSIEPGETSLEAIQREFHEEAGVLLAKNMFVPRIRLSGVTWEVDFYAIHGIHFDIEKPNIPEGHVAWVAANSLPSNIMPNLAWLVPLHSPEFYMKDSQSFTVELIQTITIGDVEDVR